jgi:putative transcriptional regulator
MIYIQIKEVMKAKAQTWGRKITLSELAEATGISRMTLSRMIHNQGYSTVTSHLDKLCAFFECELHELIRYVPDNESNQYAVAA